MQAIADAMKPAPAEPTADEVHGLKLFDSLPGGFIAYTIDNHQCEPLIRRGEVAVIDLADRGTCNGALYLRRIVTSRGRINFSVVELFRRMIRTEDNAGQLCEMEGTFFAAHNRPRGAAQCEAWNRSKGFLPVADGPYLEGPDYPSEPFDTLIGRVVGIMSGSLPSVSEPARSAA